MDGGRRGAAVAALLLAAAVTTSADAQAYGNICGNDWGCAALAYGIVTGGGLTTAVGSQVSLLEGEPDELWGYSSLGFAGANALASGVLLIIAAAHDDDEASRAFAIWGGVQMTVAVAGLVSGAQAVANVEEPHPGSTQPSPSGMTLTVDF